MQKHNWTREELIVAFNLYCKTPFAKIDTRNSGVKELAHIIGRSVSAVALTLVNFARLDPALRARNVSGMRHGSKAQEKIWNEFAGNWESLAFESERILADYKKTPVEESARIFTDDLNIEGRERESIVKTRVNQNFFRATVLASYNNHCCITGISVPELLVAGHIIPWATDKKNRMNPANGLCLNALHDRAFDKGLLTITPDYTVKLSAPLLEKLKKIKSELFFLPYNGQKIQLPSKFLPLKEFFEYHNSVIFKNE